MWNVRYVPYVRGEYLSNELAPGEPPRGVFEFNDQWVKRGVCVFENNLARSKFVACRNHRMVLQMHTRARPSSTAPQPPSPPPRTPTSPFSETISKPTRLTQMARFHKSSPISNSPRDSPNCHPSLPANSSPPSKTRVPQQTTIPPPSPSNSSSLRTTTSPQTHVPSSAAPPTRRRLPPSSKAKEPSKSPAAHRASAQVSAPQNDHFLTKIPALQPFFPRTLLY